MNTTDFKLRDASSYDAVTESFDRFTQRQTAPLVQAVLRAARIGRGQSVLDVGTGTGIVAFEAARAVTREGSVLGIDLSDGMLSFAEQRSRSNRFDGVRFQKMDAESLDLPAQSFDAVTALYALFHFPHPERSVCEFFRVLRPGGFCAAAVGVGPRLFSMAGVQQGAKRIWRRLNLGTKTQVAPGCLDEFLARRLPTPADPEVAGWTRRTNVHLHVRRMFQAVGFVEIQDEWHGHESIFDSAEEFWDIQATFSSAARKRLGAAPAPRVEALRMEFVTMCQKTLQRGGRLVYPCGAYIVSASKPTIANRGAI